MLILAVGRLIYIKKNLSQKIDTLNRKNVFDNSIFLSENFLVIIFE